MKAGDLIEMTDGCWRVLRMVRETRLAVLMNSEGKKKEIPDDLDETDPNECRFIANPAVSWLALAAPIRKNAGPVVQLLVPRLYGDPRVLSQGTEWVASDPTREGGSIFLNPSVGLRPGDVVLVEHKKGTRSRVTLTKSLGTVAQKQARLTPKVEEQSSVYEELTIFDDDGD